MEDCCWLLLRKNLLRKVPTCEHLFFCSVFRFLGLFLGHDLRKTPHRTLCKGFQRRERDSNSRYPFGVHTLSRRASSATRASLQYVSREIGTAKVIIFSGSASAGGSIFPRRPIKSGCGRCNRGIPPDSGLPSRGFFPERRNSGPTKPSHASVGVRPALAGVRPGYRAADP